MLDQYRGLWLARMWRHVLLIRGRIPLGRGRIPLG
jgi:hypothetical protein